MGGLCALMLMGGDDFETALEAFYTRWKDEPLVIDKWFRVQAMSPAEDALGRILGLTAHPAFDARNPNRFSALVQTFAAANPVRFHGSTPTSPHGCLSRWASQWARYKPELGALMRAQLERITKSPDFV